MRILFGSIPLVAILAAGFARAQDRGPRTASPGAAPAAPGKPLHFDLDGFFRDFDRNHDGYLQRNEFPPELRASFDGIDLNRDGRISREELARGVAYLQPRRHPSDMVNMLIEMSDCDEDCHGEVQRAYDILRKLDKNNDGKIDPAELKAERDRIVKSRVDNLLKQLDADQDGRISREEAKGQVRVSFTEIDRDRDGFIDRAELMRAATERPANSSPVQPSPRPAPGADRPPPPPGSLPVRPRNPERPGSPDRPGG
jgi:Ca2+-binding EF-hand superfamily protein